MSIIMGMEMVVGAVLLGLFVGWTIRSITDLRKDLAELDRMTHGDGR